MANRIELAANVAEKFNISKKMAGEILDAYLCGISESLKKGERVIFAGFGSFSVRNRAAKTGRNIQTGATIKIPAKKVPFFRAGGALKEMIASSKKKKKK